MTEKMVEVKIERERKLPDWLTLPLMVLAGPFISAAIICIVVPMAIITVACKLIKRFYKFWTSNFETPIGLVPVASTGMEQFAYEWQPARSDEENARIEYHFNRIKEWKIGTRDTKTFYELRSMAIACSDVDTRRIQQVRQDNDARYQVIVDEITNVTRPVDRIGAVVQEGTELLDSMESGLASEEPEPEYTETHGRRPRGLDLDE